jgi:TPR repeat protein
VKKMLSVLVLCAACGLSHADALSDAAGLWEKGHTQEAFAAYSRLAAAGNGGAQVALGEMYGYGVGTEENAAQANIWLQRAKQGGSPAVKAEADAMQQRVTQRGLHKADIAFYTTTFDGGDLKYADFHCDVPLIPKRSLTAPAIRKIDKNIAAWRSCYQNFAARMNAALPAGKAIPVGLAELMSDDEILKAKLLMDKRYTESEALALADADVVMKKSKDWLAASTEYVNFAYDLRSMSMTWGGYAGNSAYGLAKDEVEAEEAKTGQVEVKGGTPAAAAPAK